MRSEDWLDQLIEQRENGESRPLFLDNETIPLVTAVEKLAQLRQIDVPSRFASRLEEQIRVQARAQKLSAPSQSGRLISFTPTQRFVRPSNSLSRRAWVAIIVCVALLLIASASFLTMSVHDTDKDPVAATGTQTSTQTTAMPTGTTVNDASAAIQQLHGAIVHLHTVVNEQQSDSTIRQALDAVSTWTTTSQERVKALPVSSGLFAIQQNLANEIAAEKQALHLALNQVDWPLKVDFTRQLGVVGEPVPTIASVVVSTENSGTLLITLTGSHFSSYAQLVVDGGRAGNVSQNTSKKLVVSFSPVGNFSGTHTIGILNPDGTAAQTTFRSPENSGDSATPTPVSSTTPTPVSTAGTTPTPTHHPDE